MRRRVGAATGADPRARLAAARAAQSARPSVSARCDTLPDRCPTRVADHQVAASRAGQQASPALAVQNADGPVTGAQADHQRLGQQAVAAHLRITLIHHLQVRPSLSLDVAWRDQRFYRHQFLRLQSGNRRDHHARDACPAGALDGDLAGAPRRRVLGDQRLLVLIEHHDSGEPGGGAEDRGHGSRPPLRPQQPAPSRRATGPRRPRDGAPNRPGAPPRRRAGRPAEHRRAAGPPPATVPCRPPAGFSRR